MGAVVVRRVVAIVLQMMGLLPLPRSVEKREAIRRIFVHSYFSLLFPTCTGAKFLRHRYTNK